MVYAWFYDAYGNNVPGATCSSWTLTRNSINTADHWGGSNTAGSASIKVMPASALDSTLTCTHAGSGGRWNVGNSPFRRLQQH